MDKQLQQELEWMNENLKAIVENQAILYCLLKEMEKKLGETEKESG